MEMLQGIWKQHQRPRAVVGYGVKIFLPSPPNYVTRSPGHGKNLIQFTNEVLANETQALVSISIDCEAFLVLLDFHSNGLTLPL